MISALDLKLSNSFLDIKSSLRQLKAFGYMLNVALEDIVPAPVLPIVYADSDDVSASNAAAKSALPALLVLKRLTNIGGMKKVASSGLYVRRG